MIAAVLSDIHSNIQALEAVLEAVDASGADEICASATWSDTEPTRVRAST